MHKIFAFVLVLVTIMTGCSSVSEGFLFNRQAYISSLAEHQTTAAHAETVVDKDALNEVAAAASYVSNNDAGNTAANYANTGTIRKNLIPNHILLNGLNEIRAEHGLPLLERNQELERCAHIRAKEASYQFCHYRPDGSPCTSVSELADGEILVTGPWNSSLDDLLASWMNSPPHRASILKACDMEAGAGVYYNYDEQTVCWAVLFHIVQ